MLNALLFLLRFHDDGRPTPLLPSDQRACGIDDDFGLMLRVSFIYCGASLQAFRSTHDAAASAASHADF